jgi:hypothetical protein
LVGRRESSKVVPLTGTPDFRGKQLPTCIPTDPLKAGRISLAEACVLTVLRSGGEPQVASSAIQLVAVCMIDDKARRYVVEQPAMEPTVLAVDTRHKVSA